MKPKQAEKCMGENTPVLFSVDGKTHVGVITQESIEESKNGKRRIFFTVAEADPPINRQPARATGIPAFRLSHAPSKTKASLAPIKIAKAVRTPRSRFGEEHKIAIEGISKN
jgi:hypothetical protein